MILKWIREFRIWDYLRNVWERIQPPIDAWLQDNYGGEFGGLALVIDILALFFVISLVLSYFEYLDEKKGKTDDTKE